VVIVLAIRIQASRIQTRPTASNFVRATKIRSTTSIGEEIKPSAPCRKILWNFKNPLRYDRDTVRIQRSFLAQFLPTYYVSLLQPE
jgi:hypothetical protein